MAIVLVEQYLDFARELGDYFAVMDRGQIVYSRPGCANFPLPVLHERASLTVVY